MLAEVSDSGLHDVPFFSPDDKPFTHGCAQVEGLQRSTRLSSEVGYVSQDKPQHTGYRLQQVRLGGEE